MTGPDVTGPDAKGPDAKGPDDGGPPGSTAVRLRHFRYNAFLVEHGETSIAIDPGIALGSWRSLIPRAYWPGVTHVLVTHADPDHYWHADRVARASGAPLVCGAAMVRRGGEGVRLVDPRRGGLRFSTRVERVHTVEPGESIELAGVRIRGLHATHGPVRLRAGPLRRDYLPGPGERTGLGAVGFHIDVDGVALVNLGDTLLREEWAGLRPQVLMVPVGGRLLGNTMDEDEALEAVRLVEPEQVVPCHYGSGFLWRRNANPADVVRFARGVERLGARCHVLGRGDAVDV